MKSLLYIPLLLGVIAAGTGCSKDSPGTPGGGGGTTTKPVISNLIYSPNTVNINPGHPEILINGTIDYNNASGGVATLRLTTSAGGDVTVAVPANTQTKGTLSGSFLVTIPATPGTYTFQLWIIDNKGNASNKLQGSVQAVIDDSGNTWVIATTNWGLFRTVWLNGKFFAVGEYGNLLSSPDGSNWAVKTTGTNVMLRGIAWSGNKYIAVGDINTILSSADGNTWAPVNAGLTGTSLSHVIWTGSAFMAVGQDLTNNKAIILHSANGTNWTMDPFTISGGHFNTILYANGRYIAVGQAWGAPLLVSSTNGTDWTNNSNAFSGGVELNDVAWTGTKFVTVGFGVTGSSTDGINWTVNTSINWGPCGVVWSGHKLVAASYGGIYTSTDGLSWTRTFESVHILRSICWSGTQYVAVGFITPVILVSPFQ